MKSGASREGWLAFQFIGLMHEASCNLAMLPLSYAIRNLFRDPSRLLQSVGGAALVVFLVMAAAAINNGMRGVLSASGSDRNAILLGAGSEESIQRSEIAERVPGIASAAVRGLENRLGRPAVSTEIHYMTWLGCRDGKRGQALLRGVQPEVLLVQSGVRITSGRFPQSGEVMVGRLAWRKLGFDEANLEPGQLVSFDGTEMAVSGTFSAPGTVLESEVWATLGDIRMLAQRETVSCVVLKLESSEDFSEVDLFATQRLDLELAALRESDYYAALAQFFRPLRVMTWATAFLIALGAFFGGLNTLYAAFASRVRELATLQAIGFTRGAILVSLIQESLMACMAGTLLASLFGLLVLDGRNVPFSIGTFTLTITPGIAIGALATGSLLGILGALPPALRCLRPALPTALRAG
jgi:putative ABC transport system permease protein